MCHSFCTQIGNLTQRIRGLRTGTSTNSINKWIGYDIEQNDYVAPYGKGEKSDFEVYIDWDGRWLPEYSGMSVKKR